MSKIFTAVMAIGLIFSGISFSKDNLSEQELKRLHEISSRCDADTSGQPDIDTCVPTYQRLIQHYGGYEAFVEASKKYTALNNEDLQKLHRIAAICDADTASDGMACNPVYEKLIAHYGGYEAFIAASRKYKM